MRDHYQVNEIFTSVQGEGILQGTPSTFIRLQGCTVGCPWCDTKYTWAKGGERMLVRAILQEIHTRHVVITGGEPTMYDLDPLIAGIRAPGDRYIQLETSGQFALKGDLIPNFVTWSPKENIGFATDPSLAQLAHEVKWVVDETLSFEVVENTWHWLMNLHNDMVYSMPYFVFMPEGCPAEKPMIDKTLEWIQRRVPQSAIEEEKVRFGDRLQYRIGVA